MPEEYSSLIDSPPSLPSDATAEDGLRAWLDVMRACEAFLLAGLRREIGPDGDLEAAYRAWYAAYCEEHDRMMVHMMERFAQSEAGHAP